MILSKFSELNRLRSVEAFSELVDESNTTTFFKGLVEEVGEVSKCLKYPTLENKENIKSELADVFIYLDLLASSLEIDLEKAVIEKFNKISTKKNSDILIKEPSPGKISHVVVHNPNAGNTKAFKDLKKGDIIYMFSIDPFIVEPYEVEDIVEEDESEYVKLFINKSKQLLIPKVFAKKFNIMNICIENDYWCTSKEEVFRIATEVNKVLEAQIKSFSENELKPTSEPLQGS